MKTVYRFVLRAYVGPMVLTFFIVMFILLMHYLWMHIDELVGKGLGPGVIIELVFYASATLIPMALPLATLLASIMTMGNLGENNELLALKAAGISLPRIMKPLIILMVFVCVGSFFVINNFTPYSYQKMFSLLSDISKQKQEMKFQDGIFFNGIPDMSIRIGHQDPETNKLTDILIYNNKTYSKMQTTVADSGYIRISDDRKYLLVTLFQGQIYEENRNYQWFTQNTLSHHIFDRQDLVIPLSGFAFERSDQSEFASRSETKNMSQLSYTIDSLRHAQDSMVTNFGTKLVKSNIFRNLGYTELDTLPKLHPVYVMGRLDTMSVQQRNAVFGQASTWAEEARSYADYESEYMSYTSQLLYRAQADYQRKISLPFSIMIFFLIGAPLGAIIRKGGLGMPIVVSVLFFVVYYIISITGEKFVKDGAWPAFWGIWISSFILFPIAIFLTYKSTNDSALFNADAYKKRLEPILALFRKVRGRLKKSKN
ncbi:LptF/LptG family permease [Millionella massiliensis]|uniref:LptF/LptG family permease n=1 Tax=Millionella massiliensis TaxID=1871023 RepID=UPI0008DA9620|nr:LptF/LptG family permease [Millionella massiliensis]